MRAFVTGGAGFIGTNLVASLLKKRNSVTVFDNFSIGKKDYLQPFLQNKLFSLQKGDILNKNQLFNAMKHQDVVFHLAANSDVRKGSQSSKLDLTQNTIATFNVLNGMVKNGIKEIIFPSSMTVYGQTDEKYTSETFGPCRPISMYGATKLSCEAMISAYSSLGIRSVIIRFANIIGAPATHGVIFDLINKLKINNKSLRVLGDGTQKKPYMYIEDAINAMVFIYKNGYEKVNIVNVGVEDTISVSEIAKIIIKKMKLKKTKIIYDTSRAGWIGDVPEFCLDISKMKHLGFRFQYSSSQSVEMSVDDILVQLKYGE